MANECFDAIRKLIESRFKAWWDSNGGGIPVEWDNEAFTQPSGGTWVRLTVLNGEGFQASIGSAQLEKQPGVAVVSVIVPKNGGTKAALALADKAADALRFAVLTDGTVTVHMEAASVTRGAPEPSHLMLNCNVPFVAQHVTS